MCDHLPVCDKKNFERLVFPIHAMKEYTWMEVELHMFLISAPVILTPLPTEHVGEGGLGAGLHF
jgi:hypothetical protein